MSESATQSADAPPSPAAGEPVLSVRGLTTVFSTPRGDSHAVTDVSLDLYPGRTLALVGESGSGKSVTALSILRLLPQPPARIEAGEVRFDAEDLLAADQACLRRVRGAGIAMIFQEPHSSLNPVFPVGDQIAEAARVHGLAGGREAARMAVEALREVGIPEPDVRARQYPHELSGGMKQRVMIAQALIAQPKVLIADEPTTALDLTIQGQILELIDRLREKHRMAVLLITHDLGIVAEHADDVSVMYASRIVERGPVADVLRSPAHPYTRALLRSLPSRGGTGPLPVIPGTVPSPTGLPSGCAFHPRCAQRAAADADGRCPSETPALEERAPGREAACFYPEGAAG